MSLEFEGQVSEAYAQLGQGIKVFQSPDRAEVDILAVPGLGADPVNCWTWPPKGGGKPSSSMRTDSSGSLKSSQSSKQKFNWLQDENGLAELFPKARILLYDYASAWKGARKVRATIKSICMCLLDNLTEMRKSGDEVTRPLIMIGHSMGGIVVAKTLCMAKARREFEPIVTCTIGCAFFGTPFQGTDMARIALLYTSIFGQEAYESLLSLMRSENNDTLDEITNDFMEISSKLTPPIDLFCAYEQVPTDLSYSDKVIQMLPGLLQHKYFKAGTKRVMEVGLSALGAGTHFVDMKSAVLHGSHSVGLSLSHSDLVRFQSIKDEKFVPVKLALSKMVSAAKVNVRRRTYFSGNLLTQRFVNQVRQSLECVDMPSKFRAKAARRQLSSWLTTEKVYQEWLRTGGGSAGLNCFLWVKGGPGLGKTNASLTAIQDVNQIQLEDQCTGEFEALLAYFLCDTSAGCCTAEDLLKSLITQIINQAESLAQHARWFVPNPRYQGHVNYTSVGPDDGLSGAKATATVDNLWKCLQDMINDPSVNSIHIVISNIHLLGVNESTRALLAKLRGDALSPEDVQSAARKSRWLVTSRNDRFIQSYFTVEPISLIDLENTAAYGANLKKARQRHAIEAVGQLRAKKQYRTDLAYWIQNSVEEQSEDEKWIDVLCILLEAMPNTSNNLEIKQWLSEVGDYSLSELIDKAWDAILKRNEDVRLEIEELTRIIAIVYEPPSLTDVKLLAQIDDLQRVKDLITRCSPILRLDDSGEHKDKVRFANADFEARLTFVCYGQSDDSNRQRKRHHGLLALRCFESIKSMYWRANMCGRPSDSTAALTRSSSVYTRRVNHADVLNAIAEEDEREDIDHKGSLSSNGSITASYYAVKYLFRHLSEGFPDVAQVLCKDDPEFWGGNSSLMRTGYLTDFQLLTTDLRGLSTGGMSALHVAAGIGAEELVSLLVRRYGDESLGWTNQDGLTALHIAAFNDQTTVAETLLRAGADKEAGHGHVDTPLHLAALRGNCSVMALLIGKGADVNAFSRETGPVINAAIRSGSVDAVRQIINGDVRFDMDYTTCDPPLSLAAGIPEPSLFHDILESGREKWLQNVKLLDQALVAASYSGRLESVRILLDFPVTYTNSTLETSLVSAAMENNWSSVEALLDHTISDTIEGNRRNVQLYDVFYLAATSREERLETLETIWEFVGHEIPQDIRDYAVYQATVLRKDKTVLWLLKTAGASANATVERPGSVTVDYKNVTSLPDFWNVLNAAASTGNPTVLNVLLEHGATINHDRDYALQLAASEGHAEVVDILLARGASIDKQAADNEELGFFSGTALQAACDYSKPDVVATLIRHGANPNVGGGTLSNPITSATQKAQSDILRLLLSAPNINVNVTGGEHRSTPLISAAASMPLEFVRLLVEKGADVNAQNRTGDTPLLMATFKGEKACVEYLCDKGADVTYKSAQRGLPIQVAAQASHPLCAHVLAEKMAWLIADYREQVNFGITEMGGRDRSIEGLKAMLTEAKEQLEIVHRDVEVHQLDKARLLSEKQLRGQTYEYIHQQLKAVQNERTELAKRLDATEGQLESGNDTIVRVQAMLEQEKSINAALRQSQGWTTLQDEKNAAVEMAEREKQIAAERAEFDEQEKATLRQGVDRLQTELQDSKAAFKVQASGFAAQHQATAEMLNREQQEKQQLQRELEDMKAHAREIEEVLASVQKVAATRETASELSGPLMELGSSEASDYFRQRTPHPDGEEHGSRYTPGLPSQRNSAALSPSSRSQPMGPTLDGRSSSSPSDGGFKTIHGQHRADGSLGGYRRVRLPGHRLNGLTARGEVNGGGSLSRESLRSDGNSASGSANSSSKD